MSAARTDRWSTLAPCAPSPEGWPRACPCGAVLTPCCVHHASIDPEGRVPDGAYAPECARCETFFCRGCGGWVSWDCGADDEDQRTSGLCDGCRAEILCCVEIEALGREAGEPLRAALPGVVPPPTDAIEALGDHPMEPCS